jgi:hypothetical protein
MTNPLGASYKPKIAAILSLLGPTSLYFVLTSFAKMNADQATSISGLVFAVLASFGLYVAKQDGVSNSPVPLAVAMPVVPVDHPTAKAQVAPVALAQPVPIDTIAK